MSELTNKFENNVQTMNSYLKRFFKQKSFLLSSFSWLGTRGMSLIILGLRKIELCNFGEKKLFSCKM